jgi:DNA processing protein
MRGVTPPVPPDNPLDLLRLARTEGIGPVTFRRLLGRYGRAVAAIDALPGLARAGGRAAPPRIPTRAEAEREVAALAALGGRFVMLGDADYPPLLALLDDAPPVLGVLGDPAALSLPAVALVGGRNASANGQRMAETLASGLAEDGLIVVSGLARGVDAAAHRGALGAAGRAGSRTVAAVAGGLDIPYPPENAALQRHIADGGAVVAEAPLGTEPQARHFPRRNRVIAGLSLGVVVVEAALRSGSLITARLANEAGRELFAVPGSPLDPRCHGSNDLIRQGAHLTETAADVLANLPAAPRPAAPSGRRGFAEDEDDPPAFWDDGVDPAAARAHVIGLLGHDPTSVDDVVRRCQLSASDVHAALLELEVAGRVERLAGNRVALI